MRFLPVTESIVDALIGQDNENSFENIVTKLHYYEVSAILALLFLYKKRNEAPSLTVLKEEAEKYLSKLMSMTLMLSRKELYEVACQKIDVHLLGLAKEYTESCNLFFASEKDMEERKFLTAGGQWNGETETKISEFSENRRLVSRINCSKQFSVDQNNLLATLIGDPQESLITSAYAGTGKTTLISVLLEYFEREKVLFLAVDKQQLINLRESYGSSINVQIISDLAVEVYAAALAIDKKQIQKRMSIRKNVSYSGLANIMNYNPIAQYSAGKVAEMVFNTVVKYCYSEDSDFNENHIPLKGKLLRIEDKLNIVNKARELWSEIIANKLERLPISHIHIIKQLSLIKPLLPAEYGKFTHFFIDESHNLQRPMLRYLQACEKTIFSFGDPYQALNYTPAQTNYISSIRHRSMEQSIRMGNNVSKLINGMLGHHPIEPWAEFAGLKSKETNIVYYDEFQIPSKPNLILCRNAWDIFTIMKMLLAKNARVRIVPGAFFDLVSCIEDALELFHHKLRVKHNELIHYSSWDELMSKQTQKSLYEVHRYFEKGYKLLDFKNDIGKLSRIDGPSVYKLARIQDTRNMEYSEVSISGDSLCLENDTEAAKAGTIGQLYTGITRAVNEVNIPGHLLDWLKDNIK